MPHGHVKEGSSPPITASVDHTSAPGTVASIAVSIDVGASNDIARAVVALQATAMAPASVHPLPLVMRAVLARAITASYADPPSVSSSLRRIPSAFIFL